MSFKFLLPLFLITVGLPHFLYGQEEAWDLEKAPKWEIGGYLKYLNYKTFTGNFDESINGNLIHHRLNIKWNPSDRISGAAEFRNRIFWGEEIRNTPNYSNLITNSEASLNTSIIWFDTENALMQTYIDRLWLEYRAEKWDVRLGKQRINWGMATLWNPNDIYNTYNFLDFDYEERPGSDAVKFRYNFTGMSNIQFALATSSKRENTDAALKYFTNKWNYDFQFTTGVFREKFTLGGGWSGSIKDFGFKGEIQYFSAHNSDNSQVNLVVESDYLFSKGWYLNLGFLMNSNGTTEAMDFLNLSDFQLTPQNLMPTKWNVALITSKQITPLFTGSLSGIYAPGTNLFLILPTLQYNLATNLDLDLTWQSFFAEQNEVFKGAVHRAYLRIKWSY
ncbi:hypothetical protein [Algoriphagus sp. CAU 1675]|uniref:hypothetical protein n=1 Tax=Algoriphagus sp. CAU 1675 TaxID=3032597 RepID=UPI0023D99415|nr:hypothetical protein [Algoriphagus sp. CAU 1675]MDF2157941.1 hypothetical protein [Algoriphagus sp. CAU 1675]